jgi:hypothetical protein
LDSAWLKAAGWLLFGGLAFVLGWLAAAFAFIFARTPA